VLRYVVSGYVQRIANSIEFPYGTLVVNVSGCFLIGVLSQLADARGMFTSESRAFMFVGVLGAYTTFSTFSNETMAFLRDGETLPALTNVGAHIVLGLGAVFFLLGGELKVVGRSPVGTLLLLGAAIGWALGTGFMKRWPIALPVSSFTAWQLAISFVPVLVAALAFEPTSLSPLELSGRALAGFAYIVLVCFMFCYWAWMKVTSVAPVSVSSINTLLVPVIGVFSGMVLLGERPHWTDYAALACVIAALATQRLPGGSARIGTVRGTGERSAGARER